VYKAGLVMIRKLWRHAAVLWAHFWMRFAGLSVSGRIAIRIATWAPLPYVTYYTQQRLATLSEFGYVAPSVRVHHDCLRLGKHIFMHDDVRISQGGDGGAIWLDDRVYIGERCELATGQQGTIEVGEYTSIGPNCSLVAYVSGIRIGAHTMIGPDCHFFPYNHGTAAGVLMQQQPLTTKGDIVVEDDVWVGRGATILSGVRVGKGAVIGAGAVVTRSVAAGSMVAGNPARVVGCRTQESDSIVAEAETTEAMILRHLDGTIISWNRNASFLYGWAANEAVSKQSHSLLNTTFPKPLAQIEAELVSNGHWEGTLVHLRKDGVQMIVRSRWELRKAERDEMDVLEINRIAS
jgi:PAS domain S-box-containing protein